MSAVLCAELVGPILSGQLLQISVWVPLFASLSLIFAGGLLLVAFTPETREYHVHSDVDETIETNDATTVTSKWDLKGLLRRPASLLLPGACLAVPLASSQSDLLLRLMPVQFHWSLRKSALLMSLQSLITLLTFLLILPCLSALFSRLGWAQFQRDRLLIQASGFVFMFGSLGLMLSPVNASSLLVWLCWLWAQGYQC